MISVICKELITVLFEISFVLTIYCIFLLISILYFVSCLGNLVNLKRNFMD